MFTLIFWKAAAERAVKTVAQTEAALIVAAGTGLLDTDWRQSLSVAGMAGLLSLLTSVGSAGIGPTGPSLVNESIDQP